MQPLKNGLDLDDAEKLARLRLIRSENVGPITFHRLLEQFGTARKALDALPDMAKKGGRKKALKICTPSAAEDELAALVPLDVSTVFCGEAGYPPRLAHIDDAQPLLFVRGHPDLLTKKSVAVVGSRNASVNGRRLAHEMARALGEAGYLVVSGIARGIDAAARHGALISGTLGVMGGGVDVVYPRENDTLYGHIRDTGALVSEVTCGTPPQSRHFPRRNRIISGIARAIVVIEAGAKSGSLITARMALEQGRDVYAVPGPPQDPRVKGANTLIRDGAQLTESAEDVLTGLGENNSRMLDDGRQRILRAPAPTPIVDSELDRTRDRVLNALDYGPTDIDAVIRDAGGNAAAVAVVLLELDLAGRLERMPGNRVARLG